MNKNNGNYDKYMEIFNETLEEVYLVNHLLFWHKKLEGNALHSGFEWLKLIVLRADKLCDLENLE